MMLFKDHHTERLILREITPEIVDYVMQHYSDEELMQFYGFEDKSLLQREKERFQKGLTIFNKSFYYFHLLNKETKNYLGWCGYHTYYIGHDRAELGYELISDSSKGKGLMSEALKLVIDFGFNQLNLHRIEAFVGPENSPSLKLMEKFGFTKEGVLKEHYFKNNRYEDSVVFALLKRE